MNEQKPTLEQVEESVLEVFEELECTHEDIQDLRWSGIRYHYNDDQPFSDDY